MHPKTAILDIYEQKTFPQMMRLRFVTRNGWLNGLSLHALNYQCTEIIYLSVAKKEIILYIVLKIETRQSYHT